MISFIKFSEKIRTILRYNEKKVKRGAAVCIQAANFWPDLEKLDFDRKLERFEQRNVLGGRDSSGAAHIVLEFSREDGLSSKKMADIAKSFMQKIGFGKQPWLVYRHLDTFQPHIHIVSTPIQSDRTSLHTDFNLFYFFGPVKRSLEAEFGLRPRARHQKLETLPGYGTRNPNKLVYGKAEMNTGIAVIVHWVTQQYNVTNLDELNTILRFYNVLANGGSETSRLRQLGGLYYHVLNDDGKNVGRPIKASHIYGRPILRKLEEKFRINSLNREKPLQRVRAWAEMALRSQPPSFEGFINALKTENIKLVIPDDKGSNPDQQLFYVDYKSMAVFGERELGEKYSYRTIQGKYSLGEGLRQEQTLRQEQKQKMNRSLGI